MSHFAPQFAVLAVALATASVAAQTAPDASPKSDGLTGSTFSTPTSAPGLNQAPSAPGAYDLAGIGRRDAAQEVILTQSVSGIPLRFENGIFLFPSVLAGVGHNDNVLGTSSNPISSPELGLQLRMVGELKKSGDRYTLTYNGNLTRFTNSSADNYSNHDLTLAGDNYFSARSALGWSAGYISSTDPRGSTDRVQSTEPDRWHAPVAQFLYGYGAKGAQGRFEMEGALQQKRYDNNRAFTVGSDVDINSLGGRFLMRVMPKTSALVEVRHINSDYKLASSVNDNRDNRFLVGVTWDAAAKTTGSFKIGQQRKNFGNVNMRDASAGTWEGAVKWEPLTYSAFEFVTGRAAADSTGVGDFITNSTYTLTWNHRWTGYLSTRATLASIRSDFTGAARSDNTRNFGVGVFYEFGRNMRAGLELANTRRDSNIDVNDFRRNTTFLSLEGTL
jgi:hypothetical protein